MSSDLQVSDRTNPWREVRSMLRELAATELGLLPDAGNLQLRPVALPSYCTQLPDTTLSALSRKAAPALVYRRNLS